MTAKKTAAKGPGATESLPNDGAASSLTEIHRRDAVSQTPPSSGDDGWAVLLGDIDNPGSQTLSAKKKHLEVKPSTALSGKVIGPPIRPTDGSDMSLTEAAYWIATEGGSREFDINDAVVWKFAFNQLLRKIVDGEVKVRGCRGDGLYEDVPGAHFVGVLRDHQISYPYCGNPADFSNDAKPHLQCWHILDENDRGRGFDDKLYLWGWKIAWGDLCAKGADIARHWPFAADLLNSPQKAPKSRSGRKPDYDWVAVRKFVFQTMDKHGEFLEWDTTDKWRCQADLERLVAVHLDDKPSESTVKLYVKKFLAEWRAHKQADN